MKLHEINIRRFKTIANYLHLINYWKTKNNSYSNEMIEQHYQYIFNLIELINNDKKGKLKSTLRHKAP